MTLPLRVLAAALLACSAASADDVTEVTTRSGNAVRAWVDPVTGKLTQRPVDAREAAVPAVSKSGRPLRETFLTDGTHVVALDRSYRHTMRVSARDGALATSCDMAGTDARADAFAAAAHGGASHDAASAHHEAAERGSTAPRERR